MSINSRDKGAAYERECAAFLREHGYEARRGQQFRGGSDSPDVVGLPGFHLECKRIERGNPYDWLDQSIRDTGLSRAIPIVMHRRNRRYDITILRATDFLVVARPYIIGLEEEY